MKYWNSYIAYVNSNCAGSGNNASYLFHWRNSLFTTTIIYLLPCSLIALLPGLYRFFTTGQVIPAVLCVLAVTGIAVVAFTPRIILEVRKILFICCIYLLSGALLCYLGLQGRALVYLPAACIFTILIFQNTYTFWLGWINIFICFSFIMVKLLDAVTLSQQHTHLLGHHWMNVCANLVLLSFCFTLAALMYRLFNVLQKTIHKEKMLKRELNYQRSLQPILEGLERKKIKFDQFTNYDSYDFKEAV